MKKFVNRWRRSGFKKNKPIFVVFFSLFFYFFSVEKAVGHEAVRQIETSIVARWKSKYVSEGRNNLDDGGIIAVEVNEEFRNFEFGVWYAVGDRKNYQEVNLYAEYEITFGNLEASTSYTRLEFLKTSEHDNELGVELEYEGMVFEPGIKYYYSTESKGGFSEIYLHAKIELLDDRLILKPYVSGGFDFGYSTREHDGLNHFQFGIETSFRLEGSARLVGTVGQSLAGEDVRKENLGDVSWVSIGLLKEF